MAGLGSERPNIGISVDDCFVVIDIVTPELAPDPSVIGALVATVSELGNREVIWDLRGNRGAIYDDVIEAYRVAAQHQDRRPTALVTPGLERPPGLSTEEVLRANLPPNLRPQLLRTRSKPLLSRQLDLTPFTEDWTGYEFEEPPSLERLYIEMEHRLEPAVRSERVRRDIEAAIALGILGVGEMAGERAEMFLTDEFTRERETEQRLELLEADVQAQRRQLLQGFLDRIASNSLLAQVAMVDDGNHLRVVPMHANALHEIDCDSEMLAVRPARRGAAAQWGRFAAAIDELEELINKNGTSEVEIEDLLRRNPLFLRGLNYTHAYHQVILPMEDGGSLRPDIIAEPVSRDWADVVDLKLPQEPVFVGSGERPRLSQAIAQAASQLRQYSRWFDDRKLSRRVEDRYGFRCFRPRQVVVIGRDPRQFTEAQREAARTAYPDLEIVTYDQLLRAAKERLLF